MTMIHTAPKILLLWLCVALPVRADIDATVQIVVLGEVHDNPDAHIGQARVVQDLKPTAVVFEMLSYADAQKINADRSIAPDLWANLPWPDYDLYRPVFEALGDATIIGTAVPRSTIQEVYDIGADAAFGATSAQFGLDRELAQAEQAAREALQFKAHCEAMPLDLMPGMVEVQRFRDASFAKAALEALDLYGAPVALIVGNGHARTDWGVPAMIGHARPDLRVHAIAFAEASGDYPVDDLRVVPEAERSDPCAAFN